MHAFAPVEHFATWLASEGVPVAAVARIEAHAVTLVSRARTLRHAEDALACLGRLAAAEREGCHPSTLYRRIKKSREMRKRATAS